MNRDGITWSIDYIAPHLYNKPSLDLFRLHSLFLLYKFTYNSRLEVHQYRSRYEFVVNGFLIKRGHWISRGTWFLFCELAIRQDPVFETVQFPASVTKLYTALTDMNGNDFSLNQNEKHQCIHRNYLSLSFLVALTYHTLEWPVSCKSTRNFPQLAIEKLSKIYYEFWMSVTTNWYCLELKKISNFSPTLTGWKYKNELAAMYL